MWVGRDERSAAQRRADGLVAMARAAMARTATAGTGGTVAGGPAAALVTVIATPEQIRQAAGLPADGPGLAQSEHGPLSRNALSRLLCEAMLSAVATGTGGQVLRLGRTVRTATPAQRRALAGA